MCCDCVRVVVDWVVVVNDGQLSAVVLAAGQLFVVADVFVGLCEEGESKRVRKGQSLAVLL